MHMNIKKILLVIAVVFTMAIAVNYFIGTSIVINGKQITGVGEYIAAYVAIILLAGVSVILIPSAFILIAVLVILFGILFMLFSPLLPLAFLVLPGVIFAGVVYLIYKIVKKGRRK
jgi:hypothetical protein